MTYFINDKMNLEELTADINRTLKKIRQINFMNSFNLYATLFFLAILAYWNYEYNLNFLLFIPLLLSIILINYFINRAITKKIDNIKNRRK